jgi:signal transduction histidine kinase
VECVLDRDAIAGRLDRLRIEQLLTNLLSNAVKFGEQKPVEVRLDTHAGFAMLRITDHGIGIPEDVQERIFGRFERAVPSRAYNGLGLGLFLARQVVEAHGGSIGVESRPGAGATFTVLLPLGPPEEWRPASASESQATLH